MPQPFCDTSVTINARPRFRAGRQAPTVAGMASASTPDPGQQQTPDDDPQAYVGLAQQEAEHRARDRGWSKVRAVPAGAIITMEYVAGRLNFTIEGGVVTRCWAG
jgi:hypothetical protein